MFEGSRYEVRQRIAIGNKYTVYEDDEPILQSAQKKFRLKEDFRFTDPESGEERFRVRANSVFDVSAAYDIVDSRTDEPVGAVRRTVQSVLRHEYELLGPDGEVVALLKEDSMLKALIRRFVTSLVPFSYVLESPSGKRLGAVSGAFSVRDRYAIQLSDSTTVDPKLAVIGTVVADAIEEN